jgi:hypothetical protein
MQDLRDSGNNDVDAQMAKIIDQKVKSFEPYARAKLPEIRANIAYLMGHQNIQQVGYDIQELPSKYATPVVCNRILPAVTNDVAVASKALPQFDVIPTSTDEDDKATALVSQRLISYIQRINGKDLGRKAAVMWYDIAGIGWRKIWWDPQHKVTGYNPGPDHPDHNPEMEVDQPYYQGEVRVEPVANSELIFDWRCKDVQRLTWIIHAKKITVGEAKRLTSEEFMESISPERITKKPNQSYFMQQITGDFCDLSEQITGAHPNGTGTMSSGTSPARACRTGPLRLRLQTRYSGTSRTQSSSTLTATFRSYQPPLYQSMEYLLRHPQESHRPARSRENTTN